MLPILFQFALACFMACAAQAATPVPVYDELADANRDVRAALVQAAREHKLVLLVFGANWCPDCRAFDDEMNSVDLGSSLAEHYVAVKIDVGRFKKNLDVATRYGIAIRRGIPAAAVVSAEDKVLVLADGRRMDELRGQGRKALITFFDKAVSDPSAAALNR